MKKIGIIVAALIIVIMVSSCNTITTARMFICNHEYKKSIVDPTCEEIGYTIYKCVKCSYEEKIAIPCFGHNYVKVSETSSTCTKAGSLTEKCSICDKQNIVTKPLLAHQFMVSKIIPATCTEEGYTINTCTVCGEEEKTNYVPRTEHKFIVTVIRNATCTETGLKENKCHDCGYIENIITEPLGHLFGEWEVINDSDNRTSKKIRRCKRCSFVDEEGSTNVSQSLKDIKMLLIFKKQSHIHLTIDKKKDY